MRWAAMLNVVVMTIGAQTVHATQQDARQAPELAVHLVHLTGYGGDNTANHNAVIAEYKACAERNAVLKKKTIPLPPDGVPEIPRPIEDDIYYGANRTLTVKQGKLYAIDFDTCELAAHPHHVNELRSDVGVCSIDMIKKEARGQCDDKTYDSGPATSIGHMDRSKKLPQGSNGFGLSATGASKTIANHKCEIYREDKLDIEVCIANPKSAFVIPAAGFNATIPGLLLETKTKALTMQANMVNMDLTVSSDFFLVPKDIKILPR